MLDYVEEHLHEPMNTEHLAGLACLSPSRFHRVFKQETGHTPKKFTEKLKLAKAYQQLTLGEGAVTELALQLGYRDYETFSRAFKKEYYFAPDDVKAMAHKIRHDLKDPHSKLVIITLESADQDELMVKFKQKLEEEQLKIDEAPDAKVYVIKNTDSPEEVPTQQLIKNKFEIKDSPKLWQGLIGGTELDTTLLDELKPSIES